MKQQSIGIKYDHSEPSPLFVQMLRENSDRSLTWLHAADRMPDQGERRYCLERALMLDPGDTTTQTLLALTEAASGGKNPFASALLMITSIFASIYFDYGGGA